MVTILHRDLECKNEKVKHIKLEVMRPKTKSNMNRPCHGFDAILTSRQTREKLQCFYENLMSNNFRRTAVLKKNMTRKLKLQSEGLY